MKKILLSPFGSEWRTAADISAADQRLFEDLRQLRREIAGERGVPPYVVFTDRSLVEMAVQRPATPEAFLAIHGVGEKKVTY